MKKKMTPFGRIMVAAISIAAIYFGFNFLSSTGTLEKIAPSGKQTAAGAKFSFGGSTRDDNTIRVGVVTWGGLCRRSIFQRRF